MDLHVVIPVKGHALTPLEVANREHALDVTDDVQRREEAALTQQVGAGPKTWCVCCREAHAIAPEVLTCARTSCEAAMVMADRLICERCQRVLMAEAMFRARIEATA